jgi:heme A synthase
MCYLGAVLGLFWDDIKSGDTLLVLTMSILSAIFVTLYGTRSNWKATPQGRALMYLTVAFTGVILVSASLSIIHMISPVPGEFIIKFVVYAVFILTEVHITYVLYRGQEDQRRQIRDLERKLAEAMARENAMKQMPDDNKTWETDGKESPR